MNHATVTTICEDWRAGLKHGEIQSKHNISRAQEYAVTYAYDHIAKDAMTIAERASTITPDMNAALIRRIMNGD